MKQRLNYWEEEHYEHPSMSLCAPTHRGRGLAYLENDHTRIAEYIEQVHYHGLVTVNHEPQKDGSTPEREQQLPRQLIQSSAVGAEPASMVHGVLADEEPIVGIWNNALLPVPRNLLVMLKVVDLVF